MSILDQEGNMLSRTEVRVVIGEDGIVMPGGSFQ